MIALLISMLVLVAFGLAVTSITLTWLRYGAAARALPQQLRDCKKTMEFRYTVTTIEVRPESAKILRPEFRKQVNTQTNQPELSAAA